jgi:hypothetical protein
MEPSDTKSAFFEFDTLPDPATFTIKLTDPEKIAHARGLLSGKVTSAPHVSGTIVKKRAPYNKRWQFHLAPESIHFFEASTEVCDATIQYVADHLDEVGGAFLPKNQWCPWASKLVREVRPAAEEAEAGV